MKKSEEIVLMRKLTSARDLSWQQDPKVGWGISGNFPREIVLKSLISDHVPLLADHPAAGGQEPLGGAAG